MIPSWPWKRGRQLPRLASSTSFPIKQPLLLLQGGAANPAPRVVHAGRSGGTARTVIATGKACWSGFFCKAIVAASSRRSGPCRQIWGCHCHRQGMLEKFEFVKQSLLPLQGGVSHVGRSLCPARTVHAGRSGRTTRIVTATGKASLSGFFVKQSLLPLEGRVAHAGRSGIVTATGKASLSNIVVKQSLLLLQGGVSHVGRSGCTARTVHAGRSGPPTRIVTATGKASLNGFFVKQSLLPLEGRVAHAGRSGIVTAAGKASLSNFFVEQSLLLLQGGVSHVGRSGCTARTVHAGRSGRTTRIVTATGQACLDILHTVFVRRCCRSAPTRWPWSLQCRGWPCRWTGFRCRRHGKQV